MHPKSTTPAPVPPTPAAPAEPWAQAVAASLRDLAAETFDGAAFYAPGSGMPVDLPDLADRIEAAGAAAALCSADAAFLTDQARLVVASLARLLGQERPVRPSALVAHFTLVKASAFLDEALTLLNVKETPAGEPAAPAWRPADREAVQIVAGPWASYRGIVDDTSEARGFGLIGVSIPGALTDTQLVFLPRFNLVPAADMATTRQAVGQ